MLYEIIARAKAIHPSAQASLQSLGFARYAPRAFQKRLKLIFDWKRKPNQNFKEFNFWKSKYAKKADFFKDGYKQPLVLEVRWNQENIGEMTKKIFVHPMDFNLIEQLQTLGESLGSEPLAGLVVTGTYFPKSLSYYVSRLGVGAAAVLEVYSDDPNQLELISQLKRNQNFEVQLVHLETYIRFHQDFPIEKRLYVVTHDPKD